MTLDQLTQSCKALLRDGRHAEAERVAQEGLGREPGACALRHLLAVARLQGGDAAGAESALRPLLEDDAGNPVTWGHLGIALQRQGRHASAADAFRRSLTLSGGVASTWANAAANAFEMRDYTEALRCADRALTLDDSLAPAMLARGNALAALGRLDDAACALERAVECAPGSIEALTSLGALYSETGHAEAALDLLGRVVATQPGFVAARANFATALYRVGNIPAALEHYRAALDLQPRNAALWSAWLFAMTHADGLDADEVFAAHCAFGEAFESECGPDVLERDRDPERCLRIGFVSGDLRDHPIAWFIEPVLASLQGEGHALFAYHTHPAEDATSARLRGFVGSWENVHALDDDALDARLRADAIDILFDLSGHTGGNRLTVFARKPAPIQISWMGYPATTGLKAIDYRLVNRFAAPPGSLDGQFTETLVPLQWANRFTPPADLPPVGELPALTQGRFTFASFARAAKIGRASVRLWSVVLHAVPQARMRIGGVGDAPERSRIAALFAAEGVDGARIDYLARVGLREYLASHAELDLLLDSVPYSGGTTVSHGLWMGVPTLTLAPPGAGLQQRHGAGMMHEAGLSEWVVESEADFVFKAVQAAATPQTLASLRRGLRAHLIEMAERRRHEDDLGGLLRQMWRAWCAGEALGRS